MSLFCVMCDPPQKSTLTSLLPQPLLTTAGATGSAPPAHRVCSVASSASSEGLSSTISDFLSHAAIVGFMGEAAIAIALQQLKGFLGIKKFAKKSDIIPVMKSMWNSAEHEICRENFQLYQQKKSQHF